MENLTLIGIGLIALVIFVIHKKPHFWGKRRLETIMIAIASVLIFSGTVAPIFGLTFDLKDDLVNTIYYTVFISIIADLIYKNERN